MGIQTQLNYSQLIWRRIISIMGGMLAMALDAGAIGLFYEMDKTVSIEAENAATFGKWQKMPAQFGSSGQYIESKSLFDRKDCAEFNVKFVNTGYFFVWLRAMAPMDPNGTYDKHNDCYITLDGVDCAGWVEKTKSTVPAECFRIDLYGGFKWWSDTRGPKALAVVEVKSLGDRRFALCARGNDFRVDKILLFHESHEKSRTGTIFAVAETIAPTTAVDRGLLAVWREPSERTVRTLLRLDGRLLPAAALSRTTTRLNGGIRGSLSYTWGYMPDPDHR